MINYNDVLKFWFEEIEQSQWWSKELAFDQFIKTQFFNIHQAANKGELYHWRTTARGRLAEIIVLDQFSRNMFRDTAQAFSSDPLALILAQEAVALKKDKELNQDERSFLYMPYMHSESLIIHQQAVHLYSRYGTQSSLAFEIKHKNIIEKFGRYPHRNQLLNRISTEAEKEFLTQPNSSF